MPTIVATATATGHAGIGIVRLSGERALAIAEAICARRLRPRHAHLVRFRDQDQRPIDQGIAVFFPGPRSFTGEDVVELQAHGAPVLLAQLNHAAIALGARPARAGEFTERAFLNGRIDLAQAEAVADLIASQSEAQARAALRSLCGEFSARVQALQAGLERLRLWLESALDFPDEEIDFLADAGLLDQLDVVRNDLAALLAEAHRGQRLHDGLHAVLLGRPNVGKSSLLNALAGDERAIVTAIAGTTRDLLRETIQIDGLSLTLVDTAGLRESAEPIEREGVRRARAELAQADLVLIVLDACDADAAQALAAEAPPAARRILIHNKIDLSGAAASDAATAIAGLNQRDPIELFLSAQSGAGMDALRAVLVHLAGGGEGSDGAFSARARHVAALQTTAAHLQQAEQRLRTDRAPELCAEELRLAQQALSAITGDYRADHLLGAIFSSFCIGK
ncbi:MAG: tRNA uridine-5-carboxymethylaminomethyl(34) synthesis GTPase MnmE [Lysobacterales bacterium]